MLQVTTLHMSGKQGTYLHVLIESRFHSVVKAMLADETFKGYVKSVFVTFVWQLHWCFHHWQDEGYWLKVTQNNCKIKRDECGITYWMLMTREPFWCREFFLKWCTLYFLLMIMGVCRKFSGEEKRRHFAYLFQIADHTMQMDVNKTLYTLYPPKIMPGVHGRRKGAGRTKTLGFFNLTFSYYIFSKKRLIFSFQMGKMKFHHFWPSLEKYFWLSWKNSVIGLPWKKSFWRPYCGNKCNIALCWEQ